MYSSVGAWHLRLKHSRTQPREDTRADKHTNPRKDTRNEATQPAPEAKQSSEEQLKDEQLEQATGGCWPKQW